MKSAVKFLGTLLLLLYMAAATHAQVTDPQSAYRNWDMNSDNRIDTDEFRATFNDSDYYSAWDSNNDMRLDENEWSIGISTYYPDYRNDDNAAFGDWDGDANGYLDDEEFTNRTFKLWDENSDGYVDTDEYDSWGYESAPE